MMTVLFCLWLFGYAFTLGVHLFTTPNMTGERAIAAAILVIFWPYFFAVTAWNLMRRKRL